MARSIGAQQWLEKLLRGSDIGRVSGTITVGPTCTNLKFGRDSRSRATDQLTSQGFVPSLMWWIHVEAEVAVGLVPCALATECITLQAQRLDAVDELSRRDVRPDRDTGKLRIHCVNAENFIATNEPTVFPRHTAGPEPGTEARHACSSAGACMTPSIDGSRHRGQ